MLESDLASRLKGSVVFVGVGDPAHGDDGAGPMVAALLAEAGVSGVIDAGASPEVDTWRIRELRPGTVLFIDAVDFKGSPGDTALLEPSDLRASGFDTHKAPLRLIMEYVASELHCKCFLLAVQPGSVTLGADMSEQVRYSALRLSEILLRALKSGGGGMCEVEGGE